MAETLKSKARKQLSRLNDVEFNRVWKTTTQHIRRIAGNRLSASLEAYYHLTGRGESILDYTYAIGGARGNKPEITAYMENKIIENRTYNLMEKYGNEKIGGRSLLEWKQRVLDVDFKKQKMRERRKKKLYDMINLFKETSKSYNPSGSS